MEMRRPSVRRIRLQNAIFLLLAFAFLVFAMFPGRFDGDAIGQYQEGLAFGFNDTHSVMDAAVLGMLSDIAPGPAPMFVLQLGLFVAGLIFLSDALIATGRPVAGQAISILALAPLLSFDFFDVQKDALLSALLAVLIGIGARGLLRGSRATLIGLFLTACILLFALDTRQNAIFALAPLWLLFWPVRQLQLRKVLISLAIGLTVFVSAEAAVGWINRGVLGAQRAHLQYALIIFDLAGISVRTGHDASQGMLPDFQANVARCYSPREWDAFNTVEACRPVSDKARAIVQDKHSRARLTGLWIAQIAQHPIAYLAHRSSNFGCLVRVGCRDGAAMNAAWAPRPWNEPNMRVTIAARALGAAATVLWRGLLGSGVFWIVVLLAELGCSAWMLRRSGFDPIAYMAAVLASAGLLYTLSFAIFGVADQLRYLHPIMLLAIVAAPLSVAAGRSWLKPFVLVAISQIPLPKGATGRQSNLP